MHEGKKNPMKFDVFHNACSFMSAPARTKLLVNKWCRGEGTEDAGRRQVLFSSTTFIHYNHLNSCKDLLEVKSSTSNSAGKKPSLSVNTRCNYSHLKGGFQR